MIVYFISPFCGVAQTPDCGMPVICLLYKPFMWCRSDARLWHAVIYLFYKPFMWCRSDARLRHDLSYYPFEESLQTPDRCIFLISILGLHIHVLYEQPACVHHGFGLFRD